MIEYLQTAAASRTRTTQTRAPAPPPRSTNPPGPNPPPQTTHPARVQANVRLRVTSPAVRSQCLSCQVRPSRGRETYILLRVLPSRRRPNTNPKAPLASAPTTPPDGDQANKYALTYCAPDRRPIVEVVDEPKAYQKS